MKYYLTISIILLKLLTLEVFSQTNSIHTIDLSSDSEWSLTIDGSSEKRSIKVPGGGWNSDKQNPVINTMCGVHDYVAYSRKILIPKSATGQSVKIRFGGVNYGAEIFLDGTKIGEHHGPQVAFEVDASNIAIGGKTQILTVKAYHRRHYIKPAEKQTAEVATGWDFPEGNDSISRQEANNWSNWHGNSKYGYGIVRSIHLVVLPAVHVQETFVRTSVTKRQFSCDITIENSTNSIRNIIVSANLASWNKSKWHYPEFSQISVSIPPNSTKRIVIGPVSWTLGEDSYWWPNIPFSEDYQAQLHYLNLSLNEGKKVLQTYQQRFGFVEHAEGPNYYTINGIRITGMGDSTPEAGMSYSDCYGSASAFLPPTSKGTGCPETWRRYMRIGININRLHCSPPTEYMMEAADEVGFMLIAEAPIWGNDFSRYNVLYTPQTYHDLGIECRNHPCVARYSLTNEVREPLISLKDKWPWRQAIDDMTGTDNSRPLTFEMHKQRNGRVDGIKSGHAWIMEHYTNINEKVGEEKGIRGMGEHFWQTNSIGEMAVGYRKLRINDWSYMSGWCWINYWPNFLEGMNHDLHAWKPQNHPDRKDGIDGWGSPIVQFVQRSLNPYLLQDIGILNLNPAEPHGIDKGQAEWPYLVPAILTNTPVERNIEVFNGGLFGNKLTLKWTFHWDSPDGPIVLNRSEFECIIKPGSHDTKKISFIAPKVVNESRKLYLVLESIKDGKIVFRNEETCFNVVSKKFEPSAVFIGFDENSYGDWQKVSGADGYELVGHETKLPENVNLIWEQGNPMIYETATSDSRALSYFANPPTGKDRIVACRIGVQQVIFILDAGQVHRNLSLYFLDYNKKDRKQFVEIQDAQTGRLLDKQELADFGNGKYMSWKIQSSVKVVISQLAGNNAVISGVFLDASKD